MKIEIDILIEADWSLERDNVKANRDAIARSRSELTAALATLDALDIANAVLCSHPQIAEFRCGNVLVSTQCVVCGKNL